MKSDFDQLRTVFSTPAQFSIVLSQLWRFCPTVERPLSASFVALWQEQIDGAYVVPNLYVLDRLLLNKAVASRASGVDGEPYRRTALWNVRRLMARLGETHPSDPTFDAECVEDERWWLRWCTWWARDRSESNPITEWRPSDPLWQTVREVCTLFEAPSADLLQFALRGPWPVEADCPLSYLRRLACLCEARRNLMQGSFEVAEQLGRIAGPDGLWAERCATFSRTGPNPNISGLASSAEYAAYRARRLADRLQKLGYPFGSAYWQTEAQHWAQFAKAITEKSS